MFLIMMRVGMVVTLIGVICNPVWLIISTVRPVEYYTHIYAWPGVVLVPWAVYIMPVISVNIT